MLPKPAVGEFESRDVCSENTDGAAGQMLLYGRRRLGPSVCRVDRRYSRILLLLLLLLLLPPPLALSPWLC
jgi:hypothetical protein